MTGGRNCFHRGGNMGWITGALHHRDADGAVHGDICHRASRDHPEKSGRNNRHFRRTAPIAAHGDECEVDQKFIAADGIKCLAEKDECDENAGCDIERHAENAARIEIEIGYNPSPG
jgi:hypothetical protein